MTASIASDLIASGLSAGLGAALVHIHRAISLDHRLAGRWEGDLVPIGMAKDEFPTHEIRWSLVLARPAAGQLRGLLYYCRECTATNRIIAQGVDELRDYHKAGTAKVELSSCTLEFMRRFHKVSRGRTDRSPRTYDVTCRFAGLVLSNASRKLYIETAIVNGANFDVWKGLLHKS